MPTKKLLVDTGPIVTALRSADQYHIVCSERMLASSDRNCVVAAPAPDRIRDFLNTCDGHLFEIVPLRPDDLPMINEILTSMRTREFSLSIPA